MKIFKIKKEKVRNLAEKKLRVGVLLRGNRDRGREEGRGRRKRGAKAR